MTKPLLLLDRDGTVTRNRVRPGDYIRHPRELEPMPGVINRLEVYAGRGYRIALLSNQGGVERGVLTMDACIDTFYQTFKILDYLVQAAWFCPSMSGGKGDVAFRLTMPRGPRTWNTCRAYGQYGYRKPCPGMAMAAMAWFGVKPGDCLFVGDRLEDKNMAAVAGIRFVHAERFIEDDDHETND